MIIDGFTRYVKQLWKNKPDTSTPLSAARLLHIEDGIKGNSDAIEKIAAAVVSQIVNDPNKIASMAALYSVNQKVGDTSVLPSGVTDLSSAAAQLYSNKVNLVHWNGVRITQISMDSQSGNFYVYLDDGTYAWIAMNK